MPLARVFRLRRNLRPVTFIGVAVLVAGLGSAWLVWRSQPEAPGQPSAVTQAAPQVAAPAPEVAPPAPEVAPSAPEVASSAPEVATPAPEVAPPAPETGETPDGVAYDPVPVSDDRDLSLARRAGLHRAANALHLTASAALAVDGETGEVLYGRNELAILPIASLTKLLTAMVLLDARLPMSQRIRIAREDVDTLRHSRSRLRVGTTLTRAHALQLALMSSENRAAHALARTYPGGVPAFVAQMNRKAAELGMDHSRFADPTGLSNENRATARDVVALVLAASKYPEVRRYTTTRRHLAVFPRYKVQYLNANRLVRHSGWEIAVQKTGYIVEAGQSMAMLTRTAQGHSVVLVTLDAGSVTARAQDARKLRRWAGREIERRRSERHAAGPGEKPR